MSHASLNQRVSSALLIRSSRLIDSYRCAYPRDSASFSLTNFKRMLSVLKVQSVDIKIFFVAEISIIFFVKKQFDDFRKRFVASLCCHCICIFVSTVTTYLGKHMMNDFYQLWTCQFFSLYCE